MRWSRRSTRHVARGVHRVPALPLTQPASSIERPDGRRAAVQVGHGDDRAWSYDDTRISGIYSAQFGQRHRRATFRGKPENGRKRLDAAVARRAARRSPARRGAWITKLLGKPARAIDAVRSESAGQLHVDLLYAAAGLLLLETVLAWRMGYQPTMSGTLPTWMERWFGLPVRPGMGTAWRLEDSGLCRPGPRCCWPRVLLVAVVLRLSSRGPAGRAAAFASCLPSLRLCLIGLVLAMAAQVALATATDRIAVSRRDHRRHAKHEHRRSL